MHCETSLSSVRHVLRSMRGSARYNGWLRCSSGRIRWSTISMRSSRGVCAEVCDNHVIRCGDRSGYARTLLAFRARR